MGKDKYGYEHEDGHYSKATGSDDNKIAYSIYDRNPSDPDHESTHINFDTDTGKGSIVETSGDSKETTDISCFLTTACMKALGDDFDDNCHELTVLRAFRDKYVSEEDIKHYYEIAPKIVSAIDKSENSKEIYEYIYCDVIDFCLKSISSGEFSKAYDRYSETVLNLEEEFLRDPSQKVLKKILI